jgi:rhodanese-related sulfurtransferase
LGRQHDGGFARSEAAPRQGKRRRDDAFGLCLSTPSPRFFGLRRCPRDGMIRAFATTASSAVAMQTVPTIPHLSRRAPMQRLLLAFVPAILPVALLAAPAALACDGDKPHGTTADAAARPTIQPVTVDALAQKLFPAKNLKDAAKPEQAKVAVFDVNTPETRQSQGVIPTAVLLPSSSTFDLALLPKDKGQDVVFYCAAEKCGASKKAAERALEAGYTNVGVMKAGIAGWVKAGQPVTKPAA